MNQSLMEALQLWGMSEKESQVYLTALELGSAPASSIARKSGIKRVTAYSILKDFERQQIASSIENKGMKFFQVIEAEYLLTKLKNIYERFEAKLPEFHAITNVYANKPKIQYFDGINGIKTMYDELLSSQTEICAFLGFEEIPEELHTYLIEDFLPRRIESEIYARVILPPSEKNKAYVGLDPVGHKESIMLDDDLYRFSSEINLYGPNKIMFVLFTESELGGVIMESPKMYEGMKSIFELVWRAYKK